MAENHADAAAVGDAVDGDGRLTGTPLTYSLASGGTDHASFTIEPTSGQIMVVSGTTLDHEAKSSYEVTVRVSDGRGPNGDREKTPRIDDTITVTINVRDVAEARAAPQAPTVSGAGTDRVTVRWTAPDATGTSAVTDYDLRWFKGASDPENEADWVESWEAGGHDHAGTATTATLTGLEADTAYLVQVKAKGNGIDSVWSASGKGRTNAVNDTTKPTVLRAAVDGTSLELTFSETLDKSAEPAGSAFTVKGIDADQSPSAVSVSGAVVTLTLDRRAVYDDNAVTVSYTRPSKNPLEDGSDNEVATFTDHAVSNNTRNRAPAFAAATATRPVAEGHADAAAVGAAVAAVDTDGDPLTYSLSGTDAGTFDVASRSGQITVKSGMTLDRAVRRSYSVTVAGDGRQGSPRQPRADAAHRRHRRGDDPRHRHHQSHGVERVGGRDVARDHLQRDAGRERGPCGERVHGHGDRRGTDPERGVGVGEGGDPDAPAPCGAQGKAPRREGELREAGPQGAQGRHGERGGRVHRPGGEEQHEEQSARVPGGDGDARGGGEPRGRGGGR